MAKETVYNNTLVSGAADETLTFTRYVKDESSGKSTKELLDEKVNKTDQLGTTQIADKAVTTEKLENESVTTDKLDAASVTTDKVADANITTSKLADSSVETEKINNKAVTTDKLNDGAVDNSKLSPNAVTSEKIKDESIITEKLNDRAVTTEKVEEKAITNAKLGDQSVDGRVVREASLETKHFANESVTTEKVARKSITKDKLADNAVDASQVVDGSIGNAKLSPDSVTTEKIKDGSVTNEKIADNTLGIGKFDPEFRKTIQAATGLPDDLNQMIQDVDQSVKQLHEKDTDLQSQIDDKQQQITANDDDISLLQTRSTQMEEAIKGISASGGASQASAVTYENTESGLDSVTAQGAIDELASKKFNKENIAQEFGDSKDKVVSQFALPFRKIESPEFIKAIVDSEDKVLFGFYRATGKPYYPLNEMYHVIQNEEYFAAWVTTDDKVVLGIRRDGEIIGEIHAVNALKQVISQLQSDLASLQEKVGTIDTNLKELLDVFSLQDNEEYLAVEQDAEGKVLSSTNPDGSHYIHNAKSETIPTEFSHIDDPEGRTEITTDAEGKVLSYRDAKGTKFEKNFKTDHLDLSDDGMTDFVKALNVSGFKLESSCDWSNYVSNNGENPLHLPIPQCAIINISNESHDAVWPVTKSNDYEYYMEYHDMLGNYFKKNIIMNAQGNSSMVMIKKNGAIDIFDSSVYDNKGKKGKGNTFGIKFGNWVTQDSFHLKAFYNDFFKGCSFVAYQIANEVMMSYGITKDRPWKRALIGDYIGTGQEGKSINDISLQLDDGARCMPDGFPCIVYLNGDFYGIYTFALKKHRDNYHMKKKDGNHIHLDGTNIDFFNGKIDWSGFEVRNPKDSEMCCTSLKEGTYEYLPYSEGKELLGDDAEHYNPANKSHVLSNKVKRSIEKLSKRCQETNALSSNEEKKLYLARYFDVDSILDYILVATAVHDTDGGYANYQWITYDGEKWFVCNYDKDRSFGNGTEYMEQAITTGSWIYQNITIFKLFEDLFSTELKEKWNGYVKKGIFTYDNFIGKISQWVQRIGQDNYKKEYSKWKQAPCNRDDNVNRDYWKTKCRADQWYWWQSFKAGDFCFSQENEYKVYKALKSSNNVAVTNTEYWQDVTYSPETNYNVGDICGYGFHFGESFYVDNGFYAFEAIAASNNTPPISKIYDEYPRIMGYRDNIWRVSNYIEQTLNTIQKYVDNL